VIAAIYSRGPGRRGRLGGVGLDLYEEDEGLSVGESAERPLHGSALDELLRQPRAVVTLHQACYTRASLQRIATTTVTNITDFARDGACVNALSAEVDTSGPS